MTCGGFSAFPVCLKKGVASLQEFAFKFKEALYEGRSTDNLHQVFMMNILHI